MKYLRSYILFEDTIPWVEITKKGLPYRKLKVEETQKGYFRCEFRCELGKGHALINVKMKDGEGYIGGISATPMGRGIGRQFILELFDYFKLDKIYLSSSGNHPVWSKIATVVGTKDDRLNMTTYSLTREQLK